MANCIFCKIIAGEIPSKRVFEDETCIAFRDINPVASTHILVVPREHIPTVNDLKPEHEALTGHLLRVAAQLAKQDGVDGSGYRLVFNTNQDAGQTVFHIHLHLIGGRSLEWPPG